MATDLLQRAAAIVGVPEPNSDQLAAWLAARTGGINIDQSGTWRFAGLAGSSRFAFCTQRFATLLEALAAAVVEVDRIEREAAK